MTALHHPFVIFWLVKFLIRSATIGFVVVCIYWLIGKMSPGAKAFWIGVFSDEGSPSFSRVASGIAFVACIVWDSLFVYARLHGHEGASLPSWEQFSGQALFIGTPYGFNVAGKAAAKIAQGAAGADCPPVPKGNTNG